MIGFIFRMVLVFLLYWAVEYPVSPIAVSPILVPVLMVGYILCIMRSFRRFIADVFFLTLLYFIVAYEVARFIIPAIVVSYILYSHWRKKRREEEARQREAAVCRREAEEARRREKEREEEARRREKMRYENLSKIVIDSQTIVSELPTILQNAEYFLNKAEYEFHEGAFALFWDAVESAAGWLATFDDRIHVLDQKALAYKNESLQLSGTPPQFQLSVSNLPKAMPVARRMFNVVRLAQKNINFVTIYEQRKTNKLLSAGFSNLNEALNGLQFRLESSFSKLEFSVSEAIKGRD